MTVTEHIHCFGDDDRLLGIVTLPPGGLDSAGDARPFVVLLNSGLVHRPGPFRTTVELARSLAARGIGVLRFDQSGLGDSPAAPHPLAIEVQVAADGKAAMDSLTARYGASRFVIGGLCSGALNAQRIAIVDPRVVALVMLDGYAYPTKRYYRELIVRRIRRPALGNLVGGIVRRAKATLLPNRSPSVAAAPPNSDTPQVTFSQAWPSGSEMRRDLDQMLGRGVRMLIVYTGGWSNFVHPRQFDEMFPGLGRRHQITVTYYPWSDHTYLAPDDRAAMVQDVGTFVTALPLATDR